MKKPSEFYGSYKDTWQKWQYDYQWGAFYLFPPEPVMQEFNLLRRRYDPASAKICKAHISLSDALPRAIAKDDIEELRSVLSSFPAFMIEYGPLRTYPPYPGVSVDISPDSTFYALRKALHDTPLFSQSDLSRKDIPPHMTIAEFGFDMDQSETLKQELTGKVSSGSWLCDKVSLAIPDDNFYFVEMLTIPLGRKE